MPPLMLAEYNGAAAAGAGTAVLFVGAFYLFLFVYGIFAFFVPFYVYRIMRRQTENQEVLRSILSEIRTVRSKDVQPWSCPPALSAKQS